MTNGGMKRREIKIREGYNMYDMPLSRLSRSMYCTILYYVLHSLYEYEARIDDAVPVARERV